MTLLTMISSVCRRVGQPPPVAVIAATEETVLRLLEIAEDEGRELARFGDWKVLRRTHTFLTTATESQTNTHTPADVGAYLDGTFWNRTRKMPLHGPVSAEEWHSIKAQSSAPVLDTFYLEGTTWLQQPVPPAGSTIAYGYRSSYWCKSSGGTLQETWAADTDLGVLSERLMELGIIWRYRQSRGMDWVTDYDRYMFQVQQALAADSPHDLISMSGDRVSRGTPGLVVPEMSWDL
ncbi:MAG: hypothetical protein AB7O43_19475 [Hyphomicrobiaceae bacterium]